MSRPTLFTRGLSGLSQSQSADNSTMSPVTPAEQRDDAKRNFLKTMRPLPTQHYWNVYFDRHNKAADGAGNDAEYKAELEQLGAQIESVQDFWRYNNNTPVDQIKMRESIYLFKQGFRPVWEDRRNVLGGSWTLRVPKSAGPDVWTRVQLLAIGEVLQAALDDDDQLCGVGLSVRFNSHLITIWHRDASKKNSVDGILECVMAQLPPELQPKPDAYFYKKHSEHAGFNPPPELRAVLESQAKADTASKRTEVPAQGGGDDAPQQPEVTVEPPASG